jgi:hypothetical protein
LLVAPAHRLPLLRALSAALLTIALLSSAIPFTVLSAAHSCSMPCCAGDGGGCATGECKGALFRTRKKKEEEKLCGSEQASEAHGGAQKPHASTLVETNKEADHCRTDKKEAEGKLKPESKGKLQASAKQSLATTIEEQANAIKARALAAQCSSDCCAAGSASTQSRRGRDSTLLSASGVSPRPSFIPLSLESENLEKVSSAHLKRLRARAPPVTSPV